MDRPRGWWSDHPGAQCRRLEIEDVCGTWEVREGPTVLTWAPTFADAFLEAHALAARREPCLIMVVGFVSEASLSAW
jgi:hypothetical protein